MRQVYQATLGIWTCDSALSGWGILYVSPSNCLLTRSDATVCSCCTTEFDFPRWRQANLCIQVFVAESAIIGDWISRTFLTSCSHIRQPKSYHSLNIKLCSLSRTHLFLGGIEEEESIHLCYLGFLVPLFFKKHSQIVSVEF